MGKTSSVQPFRQAARPLYDRYVLRLLERGFPTNKRRWKIRLKSWISGLKHAYEHKPSVCFVLQESFVAINNHITCKKASEDEETSSEYRKIIQRLREVVVQLPRPNFVTAAKLMAHLHQVSANEDQNQMSASNLGIVFGPTLLRPRFV